MSAVGRISDSSRGSQSVEGNAAGKASDSGREVRSRGKLVDRVGSLGWPDGEGQAKAPTNVGPGTRPERGQEQGQAQPPKKMERSSLRARRWTNPQRTLSPKASRKMGEGGRGGTGTVAW